MEDGTSSCARFALQKSGSWTTSLRSKAKQASKRTLDRPFCAALTLLLPPPFLRCAITAIVVRRNQTGSYWRESHGNWTTKSQKQQRQDGMQLILPIFQLVTLSSTSLLQLQFFPCSNYPYFRVQRSAASARSSSACVSAYW